MIDETLIFLILFVAFCSYIHIHTCYISIHVSFGYDKIYYIYTNQNNYLLRLASLPNLTIFTKLTQFCNSSSEDHPGDIITISNIVNSARFGNQLTMVFGPH